MTRCFRLSYFTAVALASTFSLAFAQPGPEALFTSQADVFVSTSELSRLVLPTEILSNVSADLSDLRLFDSQGREVPYLIEPGPRYGDSATATSAEPEVVSVDRSTAPPERGQTRFREVYTVQLDESVEFTGRWRLGLRHGGSEFVRRVDVVQIGPGGQRVTLLEGGSYFWLQGGRVTRHVFDLPNLSSHTLEITIEGNGGSFVTPRIVLNHDPARGDLSPREIPLAVLERSEVGQSTELTIDRPRGLPIIGLRFSTSTPAFARDVEVFEQINGTTTLEVGEEPTIFRVPVQPPIENLKIELLWSLQKDRFKVKILNADSPPLDDLTLTGLIAAPSILFALPPSEPGVPAGTLRFGGGRASRPRYDLASLESISGARSESLRILGTTTLGPIMPNPDYVAEPRLGFASRPGAEVNAAAYSHTRPVQLEPSPEGLTRIELSVQDAAVCRPDFADVRLTDNNSAQWAYLLDRSARQEWLPLAVAPGETENGSTTYRLTLPASVALIDRIRVDFSDAYFDRPYQLMANIDGQDRFLAADRLSSSGDTKDPLEIEIGAVRATELTLILSDGNDQPLPAPAVEGRFPLPDLYTVAPAGDYRLLLGFPDDRPPVYELAQASETVLAARAGAATLGEVVANPLFSASSRLRTGPGSQKALFWIALLAAVGVLAVMTLKTVRGEAGDAS